VAVIWAVFFAYSLALGRILSLIADGMPSPILLFYLAVELALGTWGLFVSRASGAKPSQLRVGPFKAAVEGGGVDYAGKQCQATKEYTVHETPKQHSFLNCSSSQYCSYCCSRRGCERAADESS
jgi:hypothetical protein